MFKFEETPVFLKPLNMVRFLISSSLFSVNPQCLMSRYFTVVQVKVTRCYLRGELAFCLLWLRLFFNWKG